jgi:hypothetical protein
MNVRELIAELQQFPPTLPVVVWDQEEDDDLEILQVLHEDGSSKVVLLPYIQEAIKVTDDKDDRKTEKE